MTDEHYFRQLEAELDRATAVAERARRQGRDPRPEVEIPTARDMADRVEKVLGIEGVAERVRELEGEYSREEAALELVGDFVDGEVGDFDDRAGKIEGAVRTAVALLTEGVVAAPIEGIDRVELLENDDGSEFVNVYYAGPIRSAGGTAQALSVLVADYARSLLGIDEYRARDAEVGRYAEEVQLYDDETGLQYCPGDREAEFIAEHMPVMLDGEATGDGEVAGYRDLERVDTNNPRGGMCLVLGEGIALKAPKIQRYTRELEAVDWPWLQDLIDGTIGEDDPEDDDADAEGDDDGDDGDGGDSEEADGPPRAEPHSKYLRDLIAGRPVFGHPSEPGGFRLRYGRARNHGHATAGIHPATMHLLGDFLAPGTQVKTERPGKAAGIVPVDTIEGPTVRLANGDIRRIDDAAEAREVRNGVEAILDLGEYLVNYGEFVENNHPLSPAGYAVEWWRKEFERTDADVRAMADDPRVDLDHPAPDRALRWAREYDAPLHPEYTYLWHDLPSDEFERLARAVADGRVEDGDLVLTDDPDVRRALEVLLVEHRQGDHLRVETWRPLALSLGIAVRDGGPDLERTWESLPDGTADRSTSVPAVRAVAPVDVRERAPTRVGCRMGRPEKSERRELSPAVHALYPIGEAGGSQRDVSAAADYTRERGAQRGHVEVEVSRRVCRDCGSETHESRCDCGGHTDPYFECPDCGQRVEADGTETVRCPRCDVEASAVQRRDLDVRGRFQEALDRVGERESAFDVLKGVKGLTSTTKTPEPVEKGVLRAKHDVSAFKDGTVRYDMTDLPVTAVRPDELDVSPRRMRELGYETDVHGDPLRHGDQLVELNVQDVVLSDGAAEYMLDTADFVDDLLSSFYGLEPYYEFDDREDLVGELVFGMAPHTSAAVVGRVVGFTSAAVGYAHPYFHAAKRRNCFHPDTEIRYRTGEQRSIYERETEGIPEEERPRSATVETFVEQRLTDPETDDFGVQVQKLDEDVWTVSYSSVCQPKRVTAVSKHPAPDHLIAVTTSGGKTLRVTPEHTMLRFDETAPDDFRERDHWKAETVPARELSAGDEVPVPGQSHTGRTDAFLYDPVREMQDYPPRVVDWERVESVEIVRSSVDHVYCLTVEDNHTVAANDVLTGQCDGDEDCVMLLMDGLLNFSRQYLPDQRGGSVTDDSRLVTVDPDGDVRFLTVEEFWHRLDSPAEPDGKFERKRCREEGWRTYAFDDDHRTGLRPVERAIRYRAGDDDQVLRVETQFGRSIRITTDHSLFRYDDGVEAVAGSELSAGDLIVAPQSLGVDAVDDRPGDADCNATGDADSDRDGTGDADSDRDGEDGGDGDGPGSRRVVDVLDCLDDPYVFLDDRVEDLLRTVWDETERGSETHAAFANGLSGRLSKEKIPADRLERILATTDRQVPRDVVVGRYGSSTGVDRQLTVDEEFAWLLGLFAAEGTLSPVNPCIHNADRSVVDRAVEVGARVLGHEPETRWSNDAYEVRFPAVFEDVLVELGFVRADSYDATEKVVPDPILTADRAVVLAFLRGFVVGDGSRRSDDNATSVALHTTSEDLKDGLVFLLHRLGLVANVSRRERDDPRHPVYTVTVSGGASDNPLERILDGEDPYEPKSLVVTVPEALLAIRSDVDGATDVVPKYLKRRENVSLEKLGEMVDRLDAMDLPEWADRRLDELRPLVDGDLSYLRVQSVEPVDYEGYLYDLQVGGDPVFAADWLYAHNSMDAPLVMSSRIDPAEIDDEAHNVDVDPEYPLELYEQSRELAHPEDVDVTIGEDLLETENPTSGFAHTHETTDIAAGPDLSAYKTLEDMSDKMDGQLELARTIRAVDETDVAERIIEYHFLPDLIGNLRAFASQEVRCLDCNTSYRRPPLSGDCRSCGGDVTLTVHEGSVTKYLETATRIAEEYGARTYTKQRLEVLERSIERIFEDDTNKQSGIADFM